MIERALAADGDTLLFAHSHLLRELAGRWIGLGPDGGGKLRLGTPSLSTLGFERERRVILTLERVTGSTFNSLVGDLDYPMFIVTACADGERSGCLIGFATQASIDPSRFLVCLSHRNRTYRVAQGAELLGVHFVPEEQAELAELFGGETGDEVDKFERVRVGAGPGRHAAARRLPEPLRRPRARAARRRRPRRDPARAGAGGARDRRRGVQLPPREADRARARGLSVRGAAERGASRLVPRKRARTVSAPRRGTRKRAA